MIVVSAISAMPREKYQSASLLASWWPKQAFSVFAREISCSFKNRPPERTTIHLRIVPRRRGSCEIVWLIHLRIDRIPHKNLDDWLGNGNLVFLSIDHSHSQPMCVWYQSMSKFDRFLNELTDDSYTNPVYVERFLNELADDSCTNLIYVERFLNESILKWVGTL